MKLDKDQQVPKIQKSIKEGLKTKPSSVATDMDLILPPKLQDKLTWFHIHLESVHPVHHFPPKRECTQVNVVAERYYYWRADGFDCGVVDHYVDERKTPGSRFELELGMLLNKPTSSGISSLTFWIP